MSMYDGCVFDVAVVVNKLLSDDIEMYEYVYRCVCMYACMLLLLLYALVCKRYGLL
jgi:hypothetical protein